MGKCQGCGKEIDDKYSFCVPCNLKNKQVNAGDETAKTLKEIATQLKYINWNLGLMSQLMLGKKDVVDKILKDMKNNENQN